MAESCWKSSILAQIQRRNRTECYCYQDLVNSHNRLMDFVAVLKAENIQLTIQVEKLKLGDLYAPKTASDGGDGVKTVTHEQLLVLEQKLLAQQEELTEVHKKRGENVQLIIDLNNKLTEKDKLLAKKEESLAETNKIIDSLRAEINMYESNNKQLQALNQVVKDEHQALQLAFTHLEEKLRKCQDENMELVERLKRYKAKDVEKMNEENENFLRKRNMMMQKELEEAARDTRGLSSDLLSSRECMIPIMSSNSLPTKPYIHFDSHEGEVNAVKWSPVDRLIATGGADRKVKLWDVSKGYAESRGLLVGSNAAVMSVDFDSTGALIIGASNDLASRVWTVTDQRLRHTLTGHCGKVVAAKFLGEPSKVVTGSHDRTLRIWDLRSRACVETKFAGSSCNDVVVLDSTGSVIISGHFDKRIRIWDTRNDMEPKEIEVQGRVTSLDLSRDCKYLLCCVRDDTLRLFDLRTNNLIQTFSADGFKVSCDWARVVFSSESNYVAAGSSDGSIFIWNVSTAKVEAVLRDEHRSPVTAVSWHPFVNSLVSVDRAKRTVVWSDV